MNKYIFNWRNIVSEAVVILGMIYQVLPSWQATLHVPGWVGLTLSLVTAILNRILLDTEKANTP